MTLEQLRPILAAYNTPGAILRVLELGLAMTAVELVEATGKHRQKVYAALDTLEAGGFATKAGQAYVLAAKLSPNGDKPCHQIVTNLGEPDSTLSPNGDTPGEDLSPKSDSHQRVTGENADQEPMSPNGDKPAPSFLLSINSLSIKSLKEQDLKDKELIKPGAEKIERGKMKKPTRSDLEGLLGAYNAHRGELPYAKTLTAERERKFLMLIEDHGLDGAGLALEQATRYLAAPGKTHDFYVQNDYGLDNMLRENRCSRVLEYAEKWQELERKRQQAQAKPARPDPLEEYRGFSRGMELDEEPEGVLA